MLVKEIREILSTQYGITGKNVLSQKKSVLKKLLEEKRMEEQSKEKDKQVEQNEQTERIDQNEENPQTDVEELESFFETEKEDDSIVAKDIEGEIEIYSDKWSDYVMSLFTKNELVNGHPTCDGCRRVASLLIGPILESVVSHVIPGNKENNFTSTIVYNMTFVVKNEQHPLFNKTIMIEDVGDCNIYNTDAPYNKYTSATALTRAEGRILRKVLGLKTIVAEEISTNNDTEWMPQTTITPQQKSCINVMCKRLNLDVNGFINSGKNKYNSIDDIPYNTAINMIKELTRLQRNLADRPNGIGEYKENK